MLGLIIYRTSSLFCSPGPATRWKIRKNLKRTKPHSKSSKPINQYILVISLFATGEGRPLNQRFSQYFKMAR